jgi:hypothetical protein
MEVISVNERFGADIVVTRNLALTSNGSSYMEAFTTLMGHEGDNSISLKYDRRPARSTRRPQAAPRAGAVGEAKRISNGQTADVHSDLGVFPVERAVRRFLIGRSGSAQIV